MRGAVAVTADGDLVGVRERRREERKEGRQCSGKNTRDKTQFLWKQPGAKRGVEGGNIVGSREE